MTAVQCREVRDRYDRTHPAEESRRLDRCLDLLIDRHVPHLARRPAPPARVTPAGPPADPPQEYERWDGMA
ncbi:MAG TPA: hypothetical protein VF796_26780 [Humisphaera sp.]